MVFGTEREVTDYRYDGRCLDFGGESFALYLVEGFLHEKDGPNHIYFVPVVAAFLNALPYTFRVLYLSSLLVGLDSQLADLRLTLAKKVAQEDLGCFVCNKCFIIVPYWTWLEADVGWFLNLCNVVPQEHEGVEVRLVSGNFADKIRHVIRALRQR
jgi:hypothetical protein